MPPLAGLCALCRHSRTVASRRGARFILCERSREDPTFARYPGLPVLACTGFQPAPQAELETETEPDHGTAHE